MSGEHTETSGFFQLWHRKSYRNPELPGQITSIASNTRNRPCRGNCSLEKPRKGFFALLHLDILLLLQTRSLSKAKPSKIACNLKDKEEPQNVQMNNLQRTAKPVRDTGWIVLHAPNPTMLEYKLHRLFTGFVLSGALDAV